MLTLVYMIIRVYMYYKKTFRMNLISLINPILKSSQARHHVMNDDAASAEDRFTRFVCRR